MKWSTRYIPWLAHDHPTCKLQLNYLQTIKYIQWITNNLNLTLVCCSTFGLHSICHGIGIMIITYQYLAPLHDQQDEYHLNQASNADGTYNQSSTFWWYPNKFGSSQVRSNILRRSLSMSSGMFCNSNHRGTITILSKPISIDDHDMQSK